MERPVPLPPPLLFEIDGIDLSTCALTKKQIYQLLPHRHEFQLLDGVLSHDIALERIVTLVDVKSNDWWVKAHVEGRPLLPGVLMMEMAAQSSAVLAKLGGNDAFVGFGGIEGCKFRDTVVPPARLIILCQGVDYRSRRIISDTQGIVEGKLVFEARITGLTIR